MSEPAIFSQIRKEIDQNEIVLFMKGDENFPMCGFSGAVVEILKKLNAKFKAVDVLKDPAIREGIKQFTNWPTLPQLYIKGEFIGGCDIVKEMYTSGELEDLLQK